MSVTDSSSSKNDSSSSRLNSIAPDTKTLPLEAFQKLGAKEQLKSEMEMRELASNAKPVLTDKGTNISDGKENQSSIILRGLNTKKSILNDSQPLTQKLREILLDKTGRAIQHSTSESLAKALTNKNLLAIKGKKGSDTKPNITENRLLRENMQAISQSEGDVQAPEVQQQNNNVTSDLTDQHNQIKVVENKIEEMDERHEDTKQLVEQAKQMARLAVNTAENMTNPKEELE